MTAPHTQTVRRYSDEEVEATIKTVCGMTLPKGYNSAAMYNLAHMCGSILAERRAMEKAIEDRFYSAGLEYIKQSARDLMEKGNG